MKRSRDQRATLADALSDRHIARVIPIVQKVTERSEVHGPGGFHNVILASVAR